jgi:hypothetical protein
MDASNSHAHKGDLPMIKDIKKLIENGKLAEMVAEASKGEQITDSKVLWNY